MPTCIVADLGGTFVRCGLIEGASIASLQRTRLPGEAFSRTSQIWPDIIDAISNYALLQSGVVPASAPICIAFPGPVVGGIRLHSAPTVLAGNAAIPDISRLVSERTKRDVVLVNDVSAAAWYFYERIVAERFIVVTISSGIGAKIVDRRHPIGVLDDVIAAGEIGHLVVNDEQAAPMCDCGGYGHLGTFASARGFERRARFAAAKDSVGFARSANAKDFGATPLTLTNEAHLVPALRSNDAWTVALLRTAIQPLAVVLRTLCVGSGLDGIVLMGGFAQAIGEMYRSLIDQAIAKLSDTGPAQNAMRTGVVLAGAHEEPSLVGASVYARRIGRCA